MKHATLALAIMLTVITMHAKAQTSRPNIILILADDVGYKSLTCNGGNLYSTPNIDKMAKKGMRFTQCHATPTCSPSRYLLLTGKYNFRNYVEWGKMDPNEKTIGNIMRDAGYKTGFFGKDQLDGGGASLHSWGFDDYCVHGPLDISLNGNPYKNPHLYTHGAFLPDSSTMNKYGPDIILDSLLDFIDKNKSGPFFIYYPMVLVHQPISPTPDDMAFADTIWNNKKHYDTAFYPSMMHYMDKLVGKVMAKLKSSGIDTNTIVLYCGDNGTASLVADHTGEDTVVTGGKRETTESGTHVPLIAYWPGAIKGSSVNKDLIDFTDFLPTIAGIAGIPLPAEYGPVDGVSFAARLKGSPGTPRDWIFYHYDSHPGESRLKRWAQTKTYKLYDTSSSNKERLFYNIKEDVDEENPLPDDTLLTPHQLNIRKQLLSVINGYIAQGTPILSAGPVVSLITDSSFVLTNTIRINGGSTVTASGAVWSRKPNPELSSSSHTTTGTALGQFSTVAQGLKANTVYYVRAYATNLAGTAYSDPVVVKTLIKVPVATAATNTGDDKFTANWKNYTGANNYRLDVSTSPAFSKIMSDTIKEGFDNGVVLPDGWSISGGIATNGSSFGKASPSLMFRTTNAQLVTDQINGTVLQLKFWMKGVDSGKSTLLVEGFDGTEWITIANLSKFSTTGGVKLLDANSKPPLSPNFTRFRFTYKKKGNNLLFDDITIKSENTVPFLVPGYNDLQVSTNSKTVTGLKPATTYYYRVRAKTADDSTGSSNVIAVTTKESVVPAADTGRPLPVSTAVNNSSATLNNNSLTAQIFPNPSSAEFVLTLQSPNNEAAEITVTDVRGKTLYRAAGKGNSKYTFGKTFAPGEYFVKVNSAKLSKTIKIIKGN